MTTGISHEAMGNSKKTKVVGFALCATLFAVCATAEAQQAKKMARIGYLAAGSENAPTPKTVLAAFKAGLRELGWAEGKQVNYELRYAEAKLDKLSQLASELVHLKVDVIVTAPGTDPAIAVRNVTTTIPIVMVAAVDPVGAGKPRGSQQWGEGYVPMPATWLNQERWMDEWPEDEPSAPSRRSASAAAKRVLR